jgi:hypothetical protein
VSGTLAHLKPKDVLELTRKLKHARRVDCEHQILLLAHRAIAIINGQTVAFLVALIFACTVKTRT